MTAEPSIGHQIRNLGASLGSRTAITDARRTTSWRDLDALTNRLARALGEAGVSFGDLVSVALPNSIEFAETCIAIWKLGATPQPVSPDLPPPELRGVLELARCPLVVAERRADIDARRLVVPAELPLEDYSPLPLRDLISPSWKAPTSGGSTGMPKLIISTEPGRVDLSAPAPFGMPSHGCQVVPGPLYHNAPFSAAFHGLFRGNHIVLLPRFNPEATLEAIQANRADFIILVPTMMHRIARLPSEVLQSVDMSSLKMLWHMAAPCPDWLKQWWINWLGADRVFELYGGTEGQAVTAIRGDEWLLHRGSVGRPGIGEMIVLRDDGTEADVGEDGEIFMRRDAHGTETYRYRGATARRLPGGWESLGDIGRFDEDGFLYITDRRGDMIVSGGANVYPAEVENALSEHPDVASCAVVGVPDADRGRSVHAVVQLRAEVAEDVLVDFLATRIARYKIPRSFEFVSEPVRDDAGKVRRSRLVESHLGGSLNARSQPTATDR